MGGLKMGVGAISMGDWGTEGGGVGLGVTGADCATAY